MSIGYFGIPGRTGGQVHWVKDGKPKCGLKLHPKAQYQWCAGDLEAAPHYIECKRCKELARKELLRRHHERLELLKYGQRCYRFSNRRTTARQLAS